MPKAYYSSRLGLSHLLHRMQGKVPFLYVINISGTAAMFVLLSALRSVSSQYAGFIPPCPLSRAVETGIVE